MLSRGARALFQLIHRFINRYGNFFAGQAWIAERLKASVRTVKRWLSELVRGGYVEASRRPNRTSMYRIIRHIESNLAPPMAPPMAPPLKEEPSVVTLSERKPARKPMGVEIPSETITTPGGRRIINPAWLKYRDLSTSERVRRARDPEAYLRAVWSRESA